MYMKQKYELPEGFVDLSEEVKPMMQMSMSEPEMEEEEDDKEYSYPSLYFSNAENLEDLPKEGKATIYFKKVMERKETTMRNGKTEKRSTVELCIYGIKANESEGSDESEQEDDDDAIENGLEEAENN